MLFEVRALRGNAFEHLQVEAGSVEEAGRIVRERALAPVEIRAARRKGARLGRKPFDLMLFTQELVELLDAGLAVVEAVDALAAREDKDHAICRRLLSAMREGHAFSAALAQMPEHFPDLYIGLIRAAEKTSDLQGALGRYLEYQGRFDALRSRITSAMIYPCILLGAGGAVTLFLLGFVVPKFSSVYRGTGRNLPLLSQWLMNWGEFASQHRNAVLLTTLLVVTSLVTWVVQALRSGRIERILGGVPALRERIEVFRISRLYLTVGTLLNGGMPIMQVLDLAEGVVPPAMAARLQGVRGELKQGGSLSAALERQQLTTPVAVRLLRVGEGTGRMADLLVRAARYHDNELARWLERFVKLFEPLLMMAIGLVIGTIVVLLYMPVFDLAGGLQ
ncbi:type II secretion system F family protein [Niveibacterium sp. SC-1]|uniref:type II secretion system F family protein n=1 Tax=Niveibacterium sp. SC-1 TaxID=3135646 RepID=UPI00311E3C9E